MIVVPFALPSASVRGGDVTLHTPGAAFEGAEWLFRDRARGRSARRRWPGRCRCYVPAGRPPEEVAFIEKAASYGARAVFFEAGRHGRASVAQAFVFDAAAHADDRLSLSCTSGCGAGAASRSSTAPVRGRFSSSAARMRPISSVPTTRQSAGRSARWRSARRSRCRTYGGMPLASAMAPSGTTRCLPPDAFGSEIGPS
ncbi:hypothetical protein NVSP9465_03924 [Novosphingobium sp. CECT 9465]|nr:hypothetical protein NVSP9465_03924 [Novosphingobium sp. CECT 9465]